MRRRLLWMVVVVLAGGASAREAQACHRFSRWLYPYPQQCGVRAVSHAEAPVWYVEFVLPPPQARTQDEADQAEHDAAVAAHRDELNRLLNELHEDARLNHIEPRF